MGTHQHASPTTRLISAALIAGGLLLAAPVGVANAAPAGPTGPHNPGGGIDSSGGPPTGPAPGTPGAPGTSGPPGGGPGGPGGSTGPVKPSSSGVNNRPGLDRPAPVVQAIQKAGDQVFTPANAAWNDSPFGAAYHQQFGAAGVPQDANLVIDAGEAYQGKLVGILNNPNIPGPGKLYDSLTGAGSPQPAASKGSNHGCAANVQICIRS